MFGIFLKYNSSQILLMWVIWKTEYNTTQSSA